MFKLMVCAGTETNGNEWCTCSTLFRLGDFCQSEEGSVGQPLRWNCGSRKPAGFKDGVWFMRSNMRCEKGIGLETRRPSQPEVLFLQVQAQQKGQFGSKPYSTRCILMHLVWSHSCSQSSSSKPCRHHEADTQLMNPRAGSGFSMVLVFSHVFTKLIFQWSMSNFWNLPWKMGLCLWSWHTWLKTSLP